MKFIIDTQLPPGLSQLITNKGCDAVHTTFFPNGHLMNDHEIRKIAVDQNRIIITKDTHFREYFILKGSPPKVILLTIGNSSNNELFEIIDRCLPMCLSNIEHGNFFIIGRENFVAIM
ncbi:MAG: DUF5615 family PIN-like protein [Bacteroidia bacterium]